MDLQSRNLVVPRGVMLFAKFLPGTQTPGPYRPFGNCPEFTLTRESETLPHYSSQFGFRNKDEEITIEATLNGTMVTDDLKIENVEYWFMGTTTILTTTAQTGSIQVLGAVEEGDTFQLGRTEANIGGVRNVTNVIVKLTAAPATALVEGTDYTVEDELGVVTILSKQVGVTVTYDVAASTREVTIAEDRQIEGEMKFIAMNPIGPNRDIILPRVRLAPNGDFQLVNDPESPSWQQMPLSISALKKGTKPLAIVEGRPIN